MTDFQQGLMELQGALGDCSIASVILGPYHGWGACDGAIHVACENLYNYCGNHKSPITKDLVLKRFNEVRNHEARLMPASGWSVNTNVGTFTGIKDCFHFEYDDVKGRIFGWKLSDDAAENEFAHSTWPLEKKSNKRTSNMRNT